MNSCECRPHECADYFGHLVHSSSVSRDFAPFRWHPVSSGNFAHVSEDFVHVLPCWVYLLCNARQRSKPRRLLLTSQRRRWQNDNELSIHRETSHQRVQPRPATASAVTTSCDSKSSTHVRQHIGHAVPFLAHTKKSSSCLWEHWCI